MAQEFSCVSMHWKSNRSTRRPAHWTASTLALDAVLYEAATLQKAQFFRARFTLASRGLSRGRRVSRGDLAGTSRFRRSGLRERRCGTEQKYHSQGETEHEPGH